MCVCDIKDIMVEFEGEDLSKYGLFPLFVWYLRDIIQLPVYFAQISVNRQRNHSRKRRGRKPAYTDVDMCMGLVAASVLGVPRIAQLDDWLGTESQIARLLGLQKFFDQSTAHRYVNRFAHWHVAQLDRVNTLLLEAHGESMRQDVVLLDIDSQTHTLESRQREQAVVGYNRKKPGKPCLQWHIGFVRGEAVSQQLKAGNTHGITSLQSMIEDVRWKLGHQPSIVRLDGGYLSKETLHYVMTGFAQRASRSRKATGNDMMPKPVCMIWVSCP